MNIPLTPSTYQIVPEGYHTFRIKSATYEDKFGRVTIVVETKDGSTITEKYGLIDPTTRQPVEGAMMGISLPQGWNTLLWNPRPESGKHSSSQLSRKNGLATALTISLWSRIVTATPSRLPRSLMLTL